MIRTRYLRALGLLGDEAKQPRYIETIPRRGYRLIATLEPLVTHGGATQTDRADTSAGAESNDLSVTVVPFVATEKAHRARARELTVDLRGHFANYHELTTVGSVDTEPAGAGGKQVARYKVEATLGSSGAVRVALARASDERVLWSEEFRAVSEEEDQNRGRRAQPWVIASILRNQLAFERESALIRRKTHVAEAADAICASLLEVHYAWISDGMTDPELAPICSRQGGSLMMPWTGRWPSSRTIR